jgi:hypothetical protein
VRLVHAIAAVFWLSLDCEVCGELVLLVARGVSPLTFYLQWVGISLIQARRVENFSTVMMGKILRVIVRHFLFSRKTVKMLWNIVSL